MALLPAPYDKLPIALQDTLIRSHVEAEKDWKGLTLEEYLKDRQSTGILDVIKAIYDRCKIYPVVWSNIDCIIGGWTLKTGHNISLGFNFKCSKPENLLDRLRDQNAPFCEDTTNVHGPRDTFRELVQGGPGLHVCVTQPAARGTDYHDIHIDRLQMVCTKDNGKCDYHYVNSKDALGNFVGHMSDVIPWLVEETMKKTVGPNGEMAGGGF
jgi:hypothetical protein